MTTIYDRSNLPGRKLSFCTLIAEDNLLSSGDVIEFSVRKIAAEFADKIVRDREIFKIRSEAGYTKIEAEILVLTRTELMDIMREKFESGVRQNRFFNSTGFTPQGGYR